MAVEVESHHDTEGRLPLQTQTAHNVDHAVCMSDTDTQTHTSTCMFAHTRTKRARSTHVGNTVRATAWHALCHGMPAVRWS